MRNVDGCRWSGVLRQRPLYLNCVCVALDGVGAALPTFFFTRLKSAGLVPVFRFFISAADSCRHHRCTSAGGV